MVLGAKVKLISLVVSNTLLGASFSSGATATASGIDAIAIGENSTATNENSIVVGQNANSTGIQSVAIGSYSTATNIQDVAIGTRSTATGGGSLAFGTWADANGSSSVALGTNSFASGENSIAIGSSSRATNIGAVAIGGASFASGMYSYSLGGNATADNSVAIGSQSFTDREWTVNFGSTGFERQLTGVKAGTELTDAVNLNQLQTYSTNALNDSKAYTDLVFSGFSGGGTTIINNGVDETLIDAKDSVVLQSSKDYADNGDARTLKSANDYTDKAISALETSLTQEYRSATATAIALGVSPILADGNKNALGLGFGNYEGQSAVAINYIAEVDKNVYFQTGMSLNASARGFKAGLSVGF